MADVIGTAGNDFIHRTGDGLVPPPAFTDIPNTTTGNDTIAGAGGDDIIFGDVGNDTASFDISGDGADTTNLGDGSDVVAVSAAAATQVRLTFTSAEVGNGNVNDAGTLAGQDGGLAVRMQAENGADALTGSVSRTDDEGISFVAGAGVAFDVRDLVSGAARGDRFEVVTLGTQGNDVLTAVQAARPSYFNGGQGDDTVIDGTADDFLVGGAGNDTLVAGTGNDTFIGGGGNDTITGGIGNDIANLNVATDGADSLDLGDGDDVVNVAAAGQVRLTFTSAEVGNGNVNDGTSTAPQDGGLAVRLQLEDGADALTGPVTRADDEGTTFVAGAGVTFDVRDLVSGVQRGDQFNAAALGTAGSDTQTAAIAGASYYFNAGAGDDTVNGGTAGDFLVGGIGNDTLNGGAGNDQFLGGAGNDTITGALGDDAVGGGAGDDTANVNISTDGADAINLEDGSDVVNVTAAAAGQVRLTFTSAEVGNGVATDGTATAPQDGGLAVRLQAEDGADALTGSVTRADDEGTTFVAGAGVTFDVRDLVSGLQRGDQFSAVALGTLANDTLTAAIAGTSYYFNGGQGDDRIVGGTANDFLVGGAGNDTLDGAGGDNSFIGGGGNDTIAGGDGGDTATFNVSTDGADTVDLGAGADTVNVAAAATTQVRLAFTSAEVGNGSAGDGTALAPQDGGLAVRLQAEDGADGLAGAASRFDDEGVSFVAGAGVTFDVRDLVSGAARGDQFGVVTLGTAGDDTLGALFSSVPYYFNGGRGNDTIEGGLANDFLVGGVGSDTLSGDVGNDTILGGANGDRIAGGAGDDTILGGDGDDVIDLNVSSDGADAINGENGADTVNVAAAAPTQVRLTFTPLEVGNGVATDSTATASQDGGLAVRVQAEDGAGALTGLVTRADDEGTTFVAGAGVTFDVRDLVSGTQRGDRFEIVKLGTLGDDTLRTAEAMRPYYLNGGQGNDGITGGRADDLLVGGFGQDRLDGGQGDDTLLAGEGSDRASGGAGNDTINTAGGDDTVTFDIARDGRDTINGESGTDTVNVSGARQVRLTFTSAEVGNGLANDAKTLANQDGRLAVRVQAENSGGGRTGEVTRADDEGISFVGSGTKFDVRDLVSGAQRGDFFDIVKLGTQIDNTLRVSENNKSYYINGGAGSDTITGSTTRDFVVGGAGNDSLNGRSGNDSAIGGGGADTFVFDTGLSSSRNVDTILDFEVGIDRIQLGNAIFAGLAEGALAATAFKDLAGGSADADDRILYDSGTLLFDQDGSGGQFDAIRFAELTNKAALGTSDFIVA